jgi:hypothetical protein
MRNYVLIAIVAMAALFVLFGSATEKTPEHSKVQASMPFAPLPYVSKPKNLPGASQSRRPIVQEITVELFSETLSKKTTKRIESQSASQNGEDTAELTDRLRLEWERRRTKLYSELNLDYESWSTLAIAREEFQNLMDEYIIKLQSPDSTDDQVADIVKRMDTTNESFDEFVETLLGYEKLWILKGTLDTFNSQIEARSPVKVRFVSAW